jgi:hypothetical protein
VTGDRDRGRVVTWDMTLGVGGRTLGTCTRRACTSSSPSSPPSGSVRVQHLRPGVCLRAESRVSVYAHLCVCVWVSAGNMYPGSLGERVNRPPFQLWLDVFSSLG